MPEEIHTIIKIPVSEIADAQIEKHTLCGKFLDARLEGDNLILNFVFEKLSSASEEEIMCPTPLPQKRRRSRKRRNRMKTRGWPVAARITNSKGQKCSIYKPFIDALGNKELTSDEQFKKVESILKANRNKPSNESVQYFLDNTLEYLKGVE